MSYGLTVDVLSEILPISDQLNTRSVRRQLAHTAERMESELGGEQWAFIEGCQRDWNQLPRPDPPLTVGLDGGFVHAKGQPSRAEGWFEVIVGKSMPSQGDGKCLAFVQTYDEKPKRRLFEWLKSQNMQMNQQITFLTDGGEDIRELPQFINPEAEHILDWFHIAMRLTVMSQTAKGLCGNFRSSEEDGDLEVLDTVRIDKNLERLKWYLWHGNVYQALKRIECLEWDLEDWEEESATAAKLLAAVQEFGHYIEVNQNAIPNYGERYRHGEMISTSFVESAVNQIVSKRMVKSQQMRWAKRGAHLLLQVRTRALNDDLWNTFRKMVSELGTKRRGAGGRSIAPGLPRSRDHVLRQAVQSNRGLDQIREKLNKGGDPAAQSRTHKQNAFHKAAIAIKPDVDAVDVLKEALDRDRLRAALNSRDQNGQKPVDLAAESAATATNRRAQRRFQEMTYRLDPAAVRETDRQ
jgi:hypothetical protein